LDGGGHVAMARIRAILPRVSRPPDPAKSVTLRWHRFRLFSVSYGRNQSTPCDTWRGPIREPLSPIEFRVECTPIVSSHAVAAISIRLSVSSRNGARRGARGIAVDTGVPFVSDRHV
jgi:hypothetical protein